MSDKTKLWIAGMICGTILFIAVFVWPTPYRYETITSGSYCLEPLRTTRITGHSVMVDNMEHSITSHNP